MTYEEFLRSGTVPAFPRDFGIPRRRVFDQTHFDTVVKYVRSGHVSIYSDWEWMHQTATTFLLDIDGYNYYDSLSFLVRIKPMLEGFRVRAYYTGNRGFHVYVDFPPTVMDLQATVRGFLDRFLEGVEWERYLDRQVIGDWRHMARLPNTVNEKSGGVSRLVWFNNPPNPLSVEPKERSIPYSSYTTERKELPKGKHPPCILYLLDKLRSEHDLSHYQRLHLASYLLNLLEPNEVVELFRLASDYKHDVTQYHVNYILSRGIRPFGCVKAKQHGICPIPLQQGKCAFYPTCMIRVR